MRLRGEGPKSPFRTGVRLSLCSVEMTSVRALSKAVPRLLSSAAMAGVSRSESVAQRVQVWRSESPFAPESVCFGFVRGCIARGACDFQESHVSATDLPRPASCR